MVAEAVLSSEPPCETAVRQVDEDDWPTRDYSEDSELSVRHRGPIVYRNGSAKVNALVWAVCATLALGYLALQAWTTTQVVGIKVDLATIKTKMGIEDVQ